MLFYGRSDILYNKNEVNLQDTMNDQKYYYSEIFYSIQGEGHYTGVPSAWIRFFMCNLQCNGFGQQHPTNPQTYELPFLEFDVSTVQKVEDNSSTLADAMLPAGGSASV